MKISLGLVGAFAAALVLATGAASAQDNKRTGAKDCPQPSASAGSSGQQRAQAPQKIEGEVTAVDTTSGMITLRGSDGKTHQFRGSQDTLRDYKVGDQVQLNLRSQPDC
jgi:hypothetical protein